MGLGYRSQGLADRRSGLNDIDPKAADGIRAGHVEDVDSEDAVMVTADRRLPGSLGGTS
jgi:hypothetical protein